MEWGQPVLVFWRYIIHWFGFYTGRRERRQREGIHVSLLCVCASTYLTTRVCSECVCLPIWRQRCWEDHKLKAELEIWSFEILFLDGFTTVFIKSRPTQGSGRPCLRREGLCLVCNLKQWLEIQALIQMNSNLDPWPAWSLPSMSPSALESHHPALPSLSYSMEPQDDNLLEALTSTRGITCVCDFKRLGCHWPSKKWHPLLWRGVSECSVGEGDGSPSERRVRGGLFEEAEAKGGACLVKLLQRSSSTRNLKMESDAHAWNDISCVFIPFHNYDPNPFT